MGQSYPGGRSFVSRALEFRGVPSSSIEINLASLSESSYKQYDTCFKKWWQYCFENNVHPFKISIKDILIFLTGLYEKGAARSSINCYRSAISLLVGSEMAHDDNIKRFFKGLTNLRPSKRKYDCTWDPKIVLDYFCSLESNENLSISDLSLKLACLLALVTGQRMQTLSKINIDNIEIDSERIEIKIPDRIKTSIVNEIQPILRLPFFKNNLKICPASTLQCYLGRTLNNRRNVKSLFISHKRPFKAVRTPTLSRWVKEILNRSGIDTDIFSAHSTRHASTSAAHRKGINIDLLRKTVSWSEKSETFRRFYNLPLSANKDAFALSILDN